MCFYRHDLVWDGMAIPLKVLCSWRYKCHHSTTDTVYPSPQVVFWYGCWDCCSYEAVYDLDRHLFDKAYVSSDKMLTVQHIITLCQCNGSCAGTSHCKSVAKNFYTNSWASSSRGRPVPAYQCHIQSPNYWHKLVGHWVVQWCGENGAEGTYLDRENKMRGGGALLLNLPHYIGLPGFIWTGFLDFLVQVQKGHYAVWSFNWCKGINIPLCWVDLQPALYTAQAKQPGCTTAD